MILGVLLLAATTHSSCWDAYQVCAEDAGMKVYRTPKDQPLTWQEDMEECWRENLACERSVRHNLKVEATTP